MALLWIEGFEGFGTSIGVAPSPTGIVGRKYPLISGEALMDIETGRNGKCLEIIPSTSHIHSPNLTTNATAIIGGAIFMVATIPTSFTSKLFALYDGTTLGVSCHVNTTGEIEVYRGTSLLGTTVLTLGSDTWYFIEMKVFTNNSTGTVELKVNGASWLSLTSQDTQIGANAYHTAFRLGLVNSTVRFDDLYFLDGSGSANNDFLGNRKVVALDPDGAGDTTQWTPSAGSNYQTVDDGDLVDEDTTYNETSTDTDQDLYTYENLPSDASSVNGVQITSEVRVTTGQMDISNVIKTGTTTSPGTAETITSTVYVTSTRVEEQDPDTAAAWTPSGVDGAQFGIKANT